MKIEKDTSIAIPKRLLANRIQAHPRTPRRPALKNARALLDSLSPPGGPAGAAQHIAQSDVITRGVLNRLQAKCTRPTHSDSQVYEFQQYEDAIESRKWQARFVADYHGLHKLRRNASKLSLIIAHKDMRWIRVLRNGELIAYTRLNEFTFGAAYPIVSDVYVSKAHRGKGYFHGFIAPLLGFTNAAGVCLSWDNIARYRTTYAALGFPCVIRFDHGATNYVVSKELFHTEQQ